MQEPAERARIDSILQGLAGKSEVPELVRVGSMLRGQAWVELHGVFTVPELKALLEQVEDNLRGLEPRRAVRK